MTQFLPPNLLALFAPRDPIPYLPPIGKLPHEKKTRGYVGVAEFLKYFEKAEDTPPPKKIETKEERLERRRRERAEQVAYKLEQEIAVWDPNNLPNATVDPFKTLFIARINYDTSESKLRREFEVYGAIRKIVLVHDAITGKPRGYAFIEYEHERDMHAAYKHADGKKIDGRRVLVDVERSRTVRGWLPRRLGGGLGGTRRGGSDVNLKHSGREDNDRERYAASRDGSEVRDRRRAFSSEKGERERPERPERSDRFERVDRLERPDRAERRRSRSPRMDRDRRRKTRTRSRERKRRDIRIEEMEPIDERHDRERKRRRSRSRDRERKRDRRDRDRDRNRDRDRKDNVFDKEEKVRIKTEPPDDYPAYNAQQPPPAPPAGDYQEPDFEPYDNFPVKKEEDARYGFNGQDDDIRNDNYEVRQPPPPGPYAN